MMCPVVCAGGGLMPCCCTQTRGANEHQGEAKVHPPRPSFLPALWLATKLQGGGGKWTGSVCVPELPPPSEDEASKLKATRTQFQAAAKQRQSKGHRHTRSNFHAPTVSGTPKLEKRAQRARGSRTEARRGVGDATDGGGDVVRRLQAKYGAGHGDIDQIRPGYDSPGA